VNPTNEVQADSVLIWPQNFSTVKNTEQRSASGIQATDDSALNAATDVILSNSFNSVSYMHRAPFDFTTKNGFLSSLSKESFTDNTTGWVTGDQV
jgi:hypothetical protein